MIHAVEVGYQKQIWKTWISLNLLKSDWARAHSTSRNNQSGFKFIKLLLPIPCLPKIRKILVIMCNCLYAAKEIVEIKKFIRRMSIFIRQAEAEQHRIYAEQFLKVHHNWIEPPSR